MVFSLLSYLVATATARSIESDSNPKDNTASSTVSVGAQSKIVASAPTGLNGDPAATTKAADKVKPTASALQSVVRHGAPTALRFKIYDDRGQARAIGTVKQGTKVLATLKSGFGPVAYGTIYYLPYVTSTVAAATVFLWVFHPQYGIANQLLGVVGISGLKWFQEPDGVFQMLGNALGLAVPDWAAGPSLALVGVAIFTIWHFLGFQILIFLGGLGNIPVEYYEAARLDGASQLQLFRRITLPLLSPQIFFVFTIASIGVLRAFNEIFVLTNGGPLDTTRTVTQLLFKTFFQQGQIGLGSAMGVLLTIIILAFTLIQFRILGRRVEYG